MSKRKELRERRRRERARNRLFVILLVGAGALFIIGALIYPSINNARVSTIATQTAENATPLPVITITPRTFNVPVDGVHLGDPNAPVKVDVYEDFRCSACLYYTQNYEPEVITNYVDTGKVYYTYHTFLVIDSNDGTDASYRAANAALCASEQGRFWDYHDILYANQVSESASLYTDARLVTMAQDINLDMTAFNQCYQAKKYASEIQNDIAKGVSLNLSGTPSILVDGKMASMNQVTTAIDAALATK
jgi:protein-disulfide isomerase